MTGAVCPNLVMVVEDDRDVRESIAEVLEDNAYLPLGATNGKEAIEQLRAQVRTGGQRPCLILLDIMMPVMDAWQFRALQEQDPELSAIPVVLLSAHANVKEAADAMRAAASLTKPVQLDTLLEMVARFCRNGR